MNDTVVTAVSFANLLVSLIKKLQRCNLAFYVKYDFGKLKTHIRCQNILQRKIIVVNMQHK